MKDLDLNDPKRRRLMQASLVMGGLGALLSAAAAAQRSAISMQLGWVPGGGQVGEVVAKRLGFYEREGIDLKIEPGLHIDGVAIVASGRGQTGQVSSSPSSCCWRCPRDCRSSASPSACHPYAFFSLARTRSASLRT